MTALVNTLKKAVSMKEADSASPRAAGPIATSPSFSDFSLCTHTDAASGYHDGQIEQQPLSNRSSMEEAQTATSPRWSYIFGNSAPRDIFSGPESKLKSSSSDVSQSLPRSQEGKIGGMSYYDYCELIRSSSSL